jgi:hypothetical protein
MKNKLIPFLFTLIVSVSFSQQNTYLDALKLKEIYDEDKTKNIEYFQLNNEINSVLSPYKLKLDELNSNPFLTNEYFPKEKQYSNPKVNGGNIKGIKNLDTFQFLNVTDSKASAINQPNWQTLIIKGTSEFLADRFTAELISLATSNSFDKIKDLQTVKSLFPIRRNFSE